MEALEVPPEFFLKSGATVNINIFCDFLMFYQIFFSYEKSGKSQNFMELKAIAQSAESKT